MLGLSYRLRGLWNGRMTGLFPAYPYCGPKLHDEKNRHAQARLVVGITVFHHLICWEAVLNRTVKGRSGGDPAICGVAITFFPRQFVG